MSRKALRPVAELSAEVQRINDRNLDTRLPISGAKDEISDLCRTLNQMLERIDKAFASVRAFTGNASHEQAGPLLDVGAGSGVLAIAAAGLGFAPVLALDNERESVAAASENAAANDVEIEVRRFDLRSQGLPWMGDTDWPPGSDGPPGAMVVVANLLRPLLLELSRTMPRAPAHLIASGLLREEGFPQPSDAFRVPLLGVDRFFLCVNPSASASGARAASGPPSGSPGLLIPSHRAPTDQAPSRILIDQAPL